MGLRFPREVLRERQMARPKAVALEERLCPAQTPGGVRMNTSENAERAILGSILFDHELLDQAAGLESAAFSLTSHQQIFLAMRRMAKAGKVIDTVTLL